MVGVVGGGGHGRDLALIARALHMDPVFYDDDPTRGRPIDGRRPVPYVVGINDPTARVRMVGRLIALDWYAIPGGMIHPSAVDADLCMGGSVSIGPLSSVTSTNLGHHVHIGAGCHITRATIGDFTTICPGVTISGDVTIGARTLVGAGAVIRNLIRIGDDVTIGAGAVVVNDIGDGTTVKGNPAR